jgi:hypothetical protein
VRCGELIIDRCHGPKVRTASDDYTTVIPIPVTDESGGTGHLE